jgi:hypothetical protein
VARVIKVGINWQDRAAGRYATIRWTLDGKRDWENLGYVTEKEAEKRRGDKEAELRLGLSPQNSKPVGPRVVSDLIDEYLRVIEADRRGTAKHRRREFMFADRIDEHLGHIVANRLTESHVRKLVADALAEEPSPPAEPGARGRKGLGKKSSILDLIGCLRRIYKAGRDAGLCDIEPPRLPRGAIPDDARPARRLTESEVTALVQGARQIISLSATWPARLARLLLFTAWTPRRPVAILDIRREDCERVLEWAAQQADPRKKRTMRRRDVKLYVRRDKAGRGLGWCPLTEPALAVLIEQLATMEDVTPEARVWTSSTGGALTAQLLNDPFERAVAAAGLKDVTLYDLRKFGASTIYHWCKDYEVTAEYTGHEDIATLIDRYITAPEGAADELAARITWRPEPLRAVEDDEGGPS